MAGVQVNIADGIATITFDRPQALNAITADDYEAFAEALLDIDKRPDVSATVWQATGRWFCSGTNVTSKGGPSLTSELKGFQSQASQNTHVSRALYTHSKILIACLNGPVMGIAAGYLGYFDLIYAVENAWLAVPFTFLGLIAEAGSSVSFVNKVGLGKANEILLLGHKQTAQELLRINFIQKLFPPQPAESFHKVVREHIKQELEGLDPEALFKMKALIQAGINEKNNKDGVNLRESYAQVERFLSGTPGRQFQRLSNKEIRHKL